MRDEKGRDRAVAGAMAAAALSAVLCASSAAAQEPVAPRRETLNLYGMTGLIDMPTARMQPDGQLSFTAGYFGPYLRNTLNFQVLPRIEAAFRYSILDGFFPTGNDLYDRSFDIKLQLAEETRWTPAVALGLQDFLGTGVYSGEYVVASKQVAPELTFSGGVGWGRFADLNGVTNPVGQVFSSYRTRDTVGLRTGEVRFGQFFRGPDIGFFGGLEYRPDWAPGLSMKAEYSSDDYSRDGRRNGYAPKIPINLGADYQVSENISLGAYAMYGRDFGLRASVGIDPGRAALPQDMNPAPPPLKPRAPREGGPPPELGRVIERIGDGPAPGSDAALQDLSLDVTTDGARWAWARLPEGASATEGCAEGIAREIDAQLGVVDGVTFRDARGAPVCSVVLRPAGRDYVEARRAHVSGHDAGWLQQRETVRRLETAVFEGLRRDGIGLVTIALDASTAKVEIVNSRYNAAPQAVGRTAVTLANELPPSVEDFEITLVEASLPTVTIALRRSRLEKQAERPDEDRLSWLGAEVRNAAPRPGSPLPDFEGGYPAFSWYLLPALPISFFDPDSPLRYDLQAKVGGAVQLARGLSIDGLASKRIIGNLDDISRSSNSPLPHVRSDLARYYREGDPGIDNLSAQYLFKLTPSVYGRVSAGLLEPMFGGVSTEVLWKPSTQDWGLGAEINYARQRDYDMRFDFRDYDVVTGHASAYWDTGWHGLEVQVDAGRYLAGDWGATFSLTRRFSNGWEIGGFFTLTDVPFDDYGEGSFDKGIRLTIPFRWGLPFETRSRFSTTLRPLTRDGGARLAVSNRLYPIVREMDAGDLRADWGNFWR